MDNFGTIVKILFLRQLAKDMYLAILAKMTRPLLLARQGSYKFCLACSYSKLSQIVQQRSPFVGLTSWSEHIWSRGAR